MRKELLLFIVLTLPFCAYSQNCSLEEYNYPFTHSDTIIIENGFNKIEADSVIKKIVQYNQSGLFLHSYSKYQDKELLCLIMNEGESISLMLYVIKECKVIDCKPLFSNSQWEHGIQTGKAFINKGKITRSIYSASRDWGDYTQWKSETKQFEFVINTEGKIINNNR
nr:hypothetical protein [uncultured Carboxylicivirga sp.]